MYCTWYLNLGRLLERIEIPVFKIQLYSSNTSYSDAKDLYSRWDSLTFDDKWTKVGVTAIKVTVGRENIQIIYHKICKS